MLHCQLHWAQTPQMWLSGDVKDKATVCSRSAYSAGTSCCRSGYLTLEYVVQVVQNYTLAEIPLETVVMDTEAWSNREIFVLSDGYPQKDFQTFVDTLHQNGQRWVCITLQIPCHHVEDVHNACPCPVFRLHCFALSVYAAYYILTVHV